MSTRTDLIITLAAPASVSAEGYRIGLDQDPVDNGRLSLADLQQMFARARSGLSARTWSPQGCTVRVSRDRMTVETGVRVWPSADLAYSLSVALGSFGPAALYQQEREFDLLVSHDDEVHLPYRCANVRTSWQTPCFNRFGERVAAPDLTILPDRIRLATATWGVLRVRALAHGYRHPLTIEFPRVLGQRIEDIRNHCTCTWTDPSGPRASGLDLALPACVRQLLAACPDGVPVIDIDVTEDEEGIPTVYYSTCTGQVLLVRYE